MHWLNTFLRKLFSIRDQQQTDVQKPFLEHLEDLRITLFKIGISLGIGMAIAGWYNQGLVELMTAPIKGTEVKLISTEITGVIMVTIRVCFYAGLVISFPALIYFIAEFILPALTRREKRFLYPGVFFSFTLFAIGVFISYVYLVPRTIHWLIKFNREHGVENIMAAGSYYSFVTQMCIASGLLAEMPIVIVALSLLNIVSYALMARTRAYALVLICVLVAILAPSPDPFTFITLAIPVLAIYELCIWIVWFIERRKSARLLP